MVVLKFRPLNISRIVMLAVGASAAAGIVISGVIASSGAHGSMTYIEETHNEARRVELKIELDDVRPDEGVALATVWAMVHIPHVDMSGINSGSGLLLRFQGEESDYSLGFVFEQTTWVNKDDYWQSRPARVRLTTSGRQGAFPEDSYRIDGDILLSGTGAFSGVGGDGVSGQRYPVFLNIQLGQNSADWSIDRISTIGGGDWDGKRVPANFALFVSRPSAFKVFVFIVASLPLLIALAFIVKARIRSHSDSDSTSPLELAAALLALLTLRQVLTPANVSSLTLLDRILAAELALILLATLFVYLYAAPGGQAEREQSATAGDISLVKPDPRWDRTQSGLWVPPDVMNGRRSGRPDLPRGHHRS